MHIFVVNLPEDNLRRKGIEKQLNSLGLDFEIFPAIRGKNLTTEETAKHYDAKWFVRNEGRPATPGEIGCSLSHIEIYRQIKAQNLSHALILEDDAWLNPNLPQLLEAIDLKYSPEQKNVFLLTWFNALELHNVQPLWSDYRVAELKSAYCTHGYVVSKAAADALINALYPVSHTADCWGWLKLHRIVNIFAVFPTCITADLSFVTGTTAELRNIEKKSITQRVIHKGFRGFWIGYGYLLAFKRRLGKNS